MSPGRVWFAATTSSVKLKYDRNISNWGNSLFIRSSDILFNSKMAGGCVPGAKGKCWCPPSADKLLMLVLCVPSSSRDWLRSLSAQVSANDIRLRTESGHWRFLGLLTRGRDAGTLLSEDIKPALYSRSAFGRGPIISVMNCGTEEIYSTASIERSIPMI